MLGASFKRALKSDSEVGAGSDLLHTGSEPATKKPRKIAERKVVLDNRLPVAQPTTVASYTIQTPLYRFFSLVFGSIVLRGTPGLLSVTVRLHQS
jgi:hypothetical protein